MDGKGFEGWALERLSELGEITFCKVYVLRIERFNVTVEEFLRKLVVERVAQEMITLEHPRGHVCDEPVVRTGHQSVCAGDGGYALLGGLRTGLRRAQEPQGAQ